MAQGIITHSFVAHPPGEEDPMGHGRDELPDVDSEGVYYVSVEDFEWRPPKASKDDEAADKDQDANPAG